jgi:hypothetical protein
MKNKQNQIVQIKWRLIWTKISFQNIEISFKFPSQSLNFLQNELAGFVFVNYCLFFLDCRERISECKIKIQSQISEVRTINKTFIL